MARGLTILGGLVLVPLVTALVSTAQNLTPSSDHLGSGLFVGLLGAVALLTGGILLYRTLGKETS